MICTRRTKRCYYYPQSVLRSEQQLDTWSVVLSVNTEMPHFTHSLLQQLLQAVDVWPVPSLPLHHHTVSAGRERGEGVLNDSLIRMFSR